MSASTALGAVSQALRALLSDEMSITPKVPVTLLGLTGTAPPRRINLFLYRVDEHPQLRNAEPRLRPGATATLLAPPLSLVLGYLMTAYAAPDSETGDADAQAILGDAMRVFHQFPVLPPARLGPELAGARERLQISLRDSDPEEMGRLWSTVEEPLRLSVQYEVSVVQLDQSPVTQRPLAPRVRRTGVPTVRAPFLPPRITGIRPPSAAPGATLTVDGAHLDGWRATVTLSGHRIAKEVPISGDSVPVQLPTGIELGFHELRVDVSRLTRATFFVEVV